VRERTGLDVGVSVGLQAMISSQMKKIILNVQKELTAQNQHTYVHVEKTWYESSANRNGLQMKVAHSNNKKTNITCAVV